MTTSIDEQINDILVRIQNAAKSGNNIRLRNVIRDLIEGVNENPEQIHSNKLKDIGDNTVSLCGYLGSIAVSLKDASCKLGRKLTNDEVDAYNNGRLDLKIASRAVVVRVSLRGQKPYVPDWMIK